MKEIRLVALVGLLACLISGCAAEVLHGDYFRAIRQDERNKIEWQKEVDQMLREVAR